MNSFGEAVKLIKSSRTIALISHISPDGDTVGSAIALYEALKMYGKRPYIFSDDVIPEKLGVIGDVSHYNAASLPEYDLAVSVDTATYERMGKVSSEFKKARKTLVIDHHTGNTRYGDVNVIVEAAATAEIMADFIGEFIDIEGRTARALYAGLVTDTGGFQFSSVTENTFRVAGMLRKHVPDAHILCEKLMNSVSRRVFELRRRALNKAEFLCGGKVAFAMLTAADFEASGTTGADTEGIVNILRSVEGVAVAATMTEHAYGAYKISIRTDDSVNANYIAMRFGGGGHLRASGCRLNGSPEDVRERIIKACADELPF